MKLGFNPFSLRKQVKHWCSLASEQAICIEQSKKELKILKIENEQLKNRIKCLENENDQLTRVNDTFSKVTRGNGKKIIGRNSVVGYKLNKKN
ncbi:hypothetical protein [Pasteurella sp. PK-2025]|uniref:hypothetical protein n=1 Tax=unclassified Pasteurella TaxID=2621516 RepID=UPI003C72EFBC